MNPVAGTYSSKIQPGTPEFDDLVRRVIFQESRGRADAVSPAGAAGLMQVMPGTARDPGFGVKPLDWNKRFDPVANEQFGRDYLGAMLNRYGGNVDRALIAYNAGPGTADKWSGVPGRLPSETQQYIANIQNNPAYGNPQYGSGAVGKMGHISQQAGAAAKQSVAGGPALSGNPATELTSYNPGGTVGYGGFTNTNISGVVGDGPVGYSMGTPNLSPVPSRASATQTLQRGVRPVAQATPMIQTPQISYGNIVR